MPRKNFPILRPSKLLFGLNFESILFKRRSYEFGRVQPPTKMAAANTKPKLPVARDLTQVLNRISLGLAKHERILKTLNRPSPSPSSTTNNNNKSGFSTLTSSKPSTPIPTAARVLPTRAEEEAEFAAERALPPNAGIGFAVVKPKDELGRGGAAASKEDKMLRGRILGKNARSQMEDAKKRGKRRYESESEEEEGRSGLGKGKARKVVKREVTVEVKDEQDKKEDLKVKAEEEKSNEEKEAQAPALVLEEKPQVKEEEQQTSLEATPTVADTPAETISKNKKKKLRKKAAKKAAATSQQPSADPDQETGVTHAPAAEEARPLENLLAVAVEGKDAAPNGDSVEEGSAAVKEGGEKEKKKIRRKRGKKAKKTEGAEQGDGDVDMEEWGGLSS